MREMCETLMKHLLRPTDVRFFRKEVLGFIRGFRAKFEGKRKDHSALVSVLFAFGLTRLNITCFHINTAAVK